MRRGYAGVTYQALNPINPVPITFADNDIPHTNHWLYVLFVPALPSSKAPRPVPETKESVLVVSAQAIAVTMMVSCE